ncbi:MAG: hypothetical protein O7G87_02025 [bacterium]|nr:hypothetical protein [bacterium]
MIAYQSGDKEYILVANSNRALMKIDPKNIETQTGITEPVPERGGTVGVPFSAINLSNVQQLDNLNANHVVVIQRMDNGSLNLKSLAKGQL